MPAFGSKAKENYKVRGVPNVILVDKKGKVVFIGHPMSCNLENDINSLLEDKPVLPVASKNSDKSALSSVLKSEAQVDSAFAEFKTKAQDMMQTHKSELAKLQQGVIVLITEATLNIENE